MVIFKYFIIFLKIWTGQSLFNIVTLKNTQTEPQKDIIIFFNQTINI